MSFLPEITDETNLALTQKLMDVGWMRQQIAAQNMGNLETDNYKAQKVSDSFFDQLQAMSDSGDTQGIRNLQINVVQDANAEVDARGNSVNLERQIMELRNNKVTQAFLEKVAAHHYSQLGTAVSGQV